MKKLLFILMLFPIFGTAQINVAGLIDDLGQFVASEVKTVNYNTTLKYENGVTSSADFRNKITSYDVDIPLLGYSSQAPEIEPIRLINGYVWCGSKKVEMPQGRIEELILHRETWYDENNNITSDVVYSINPITPRNVLLDFINHSSVTQAELDNIPYIRTQSAIDIINARPIQSIEELDAIKNIGATAINRLKDYAETWVNPD